MQPDDKAWQELEDLLALLEELREGKALKTASQLSIAEDEITSILFDKLAVRLQSIPYASGGRVPPHDAGALVNEAIYEIFETYADYRGKHRLMEYSRWVMRKKINEYARQQGRYVTMDDEALTKMVSEKEYDKEPPPEREDEPTLDGSLEEIFRTIDVDRQQLSGKELLAFVLKTVNFCMAKKLPEAKLAALLGMKRTTFRDTYKKARDKIYRQWQEKAKGERRRMKDEG